MRGNHLVDNLCLTPNKDKRIYVDFSIAQNQTFLVKIDSRTYRKSVVYRKQ